jgi:hypothetical protein
MCNPSKLTGRDLACSLPQKGTCGATGDDCVIQLAIQRACRLAKSCQSDCPLSLAPLLVGNALTGNSEAGSHLTGRHSKCLANRTKPTATWSWGLGEVTNWLHPSL